jgi:hypothetical protein
MAQKYTSGNVQDEFTEALPGTPEKKVVILENPSDFESFLSLKEREKILCIATTPEVSFRLEKNKIPHRNIDSYLGSDEICRMGMAHFKTVEDLCNGIDEYLWKNFVNLREFSLKPAQDNFQYVKILYDVLTITISRLQAILEKEKPSVVITFSHAAEIVPPKDLPFHAEENLFDLIMNEPGWRCRHISVRGDPSIPRQACDGYSGTLLGSSFRIIRAVFPRMYSFFNIIRRSGARGGLQFLKITLLKTSQRKKNLFISGYGYDWMYLINDLAANNYIFKYTQDNGTKKAGTGKKISVPPDIVKNACLHKNVDFSGIFLSRLVTILEQSLGEADEYAPIVEKMLKTHSPCAVLCSTKSNFSDHLTAHIAQKTGIPVISWQHGAAGFFKYPLLKYVEIDDSNVHLVWGEGVKDEIGKEFPGIPCKIVSVGSFPLNNKAGRCNDKKTGKSLYVTTNYFHNSLYVGYDHRIQDIEFWETQKGIINLLGSVSSDVVVKLHPGFSQCSQVSEFIQDRRFNRITLVKDNPSFISLLHSSDIIIIDLPSTTLLQAIASGKIVFVLLKYLTLTDTAERLLKKRAYCSENLIEFLDMIDGYLNGKTLEQTPDVNNTEFLEEYGIGSREGDVSERIITILDDICR